MLVKKIVTEWLTESWEPQLPANDSSFIAVPKIITDCAPSLIDADLHSARHAVWTIDKPHRSIIAKNCIEMRDIMSTICKYPHQCHTAYSPRLEYTLICITTGKRSKYIQFRLHLTEASSLWTQLWIPMPLLGQSNSLLSVPVQATFSRTMAPLPGPNRAKLKAWAPTITIVVCEHHSLEYVAKLVIMSWSLTESWKS